LEIFFEIASTICDHQILVICLINGFVELSAFGFEDSMAYASDSGSIYRPSILELAQAGNCRALTYWMNSFLSPQGVDVQVLPATDQFLKIVIDFRKPRQREACLRLRERLVRFICYRLWTLNSDVIRGVRIVARVAGDSKVLWQLSVQINSPANARLRRAKQMSLRQLQTANQLKFRTFRSLFMSSITLAGFFVGYRLFYGEIGRLLAKENPTDAPMLAGNSSESVVAVANQPRAEQVPRLPSPPGYTNFVVPEHFRGQVISQVDLPETEKVIALTFDDGPQAETTAQVLDVLKEYNVPATFFVSGVNVKKQPELTKRIVADGHAVGNRGWHRGMENGKEADPEQEIDQTSKLIHKVTGAKTALFRPPDGRLDSELVTYAQQKEYAVTLWSVDSQDSLVAAPLLLDNVLRNTRSGRIILLHDGGAPAQSATVQALPQLITALQQQGYRFVTVPQLLEMQPHQPKPTRQKETKLPFRKRAVAVAWAEAKLPMVMPTWESSS
jgi:peptidoglycan/xylan/chitin deacetylase (PgdA/CDA1 family)